MENLSEVFGFIKKKVKTLNTNAGNFLNYAPNFISIEQIKFLKKKELNKLIQLNFFYRNKKFSKYFWNEIISYLNNKKIDEKALFNNIKKNFKNKNVLEIISIYQITLLIGKFNLAFKLRNFFSKIF